MGKNWFEDDGFWLAFAPVMFNEDRWADAPLEAERTAALLRLPAGGRVLDSCCGVGRHSLALSRLGYEVTGVDRTRAYLEAARDSAESENLRIEFILDDVRSFRRDSYFDGTMNLFSSFGYFDDPEDERDYVRNVSRSLVPGGRFLADLNGKEIAGNSFKERDWFEHEDALVLAEYSILDDWSALRNRWIILRNGDRFERTFLYKLYSAAEITRLFLENGFSNVEIYGGLDGRAYDLDAVRLIAVATR